MKRLILALVVGTVVFSVVYALAASLNVAAGTAASGIGDVESAGDVTGSTFILQGYTINNPHGVTSLSGSPTSSNVCTVNIESAEPNDLNVFVEVLDSGFTVLAYGGTFGGSISAIHTGGGLGWDENDTIDNVRGATVALSTCVPAVDIEWYRVTMD